MGLCRVNGVRQLRNRGGRIKMAGRERVLRGKCRVSISCGQSSASRSLEVREVWALRLLTVIESLLGRGPGRVNRGWLGRKVKVF